MPAAHPSFGLVGSRRVRAAARAAWASGITVPPSRVAGVRPGDTVLVPSFTFAASANAVVYLGAQPVFLDCSADTWNLDPDLVDE